MLTIDFGAFLGATPQIKIFEDIICRDYYAKLNQTIILPLDDAICKTEPVQSELALINGWKRTFDVLPSMFPLFGTSDGLFASANQLHFS